jgi:hypothetical protein
MSTEISDAAHTLDEEKIATKHRDHVSNDHIPTDPTEGFPGDSFGQVSQVFLTEEDLDSSTRTDSRQEDSDDETGSDLGKSKSPNTDTLSAEIGAHSHGLSAEQKLRNIVKTSNSVVDICKRLDFSLPLAQLTNALQWEKKSG